MLRRDYATWQVGDVELSLARPRIMGVVNVTPDSFSDGGDHASAEAAIAYARQLLDDGADIIDVGGESTRPGFTPVSENVEAERVVPVVRALVEDGALVSVDTRHPAVARMCVRLGAAIVNDVTGFTNPDMVAVARDSKCGCVVMHSGEVSGGATRKRVVLDSDPRAKAAGAAGTGTPAGAGAEAAAAEKDRETASAAAGAAASEVPAAGEGDRDRLAALMEQAAHAQAAAAAGGIATGLASGASRRFTVPESAPIMRRIMGFLADQARLLTREGVAHDRICVDPGAGFGKLADEDVVIQRATASMASMGYPLMCAPSRKRFVGTLSGRANPLDRDPATVGLALAAAEAGARILRVHNVAALADALGAYWAVAHPTATRAYVALGSNVPGAKAQVAQAVSLIDSIPLTCVTQVSHAYESDPAYGLKDPVVNAVIELKTELAPRVLMRELLLVEEALGRVRTPEEKDAALAAAEPATAEKPGEAPSAATTQGAPAPSVKSRPRGGKRAQAPGTEPRAIDCDLILVEGEHSAGRLLELPHPRLGERDFVLVPMEDLMPNPERTLRYAGIPVLPREERVGIVRKDLGELLWRL
jgi:2-amino-4-hydroxy-6-hydroxymethyldihydropteridine diphosphokinase